MRTSEEYDELLAGFRALHVQVGRRLFDLRWHHLSGAVQLSSPDKDGGWRDVQRVEPFGSASKKPRLTKTRRRGAKDSPAENRPVGLTGRQNVGQLCLPLDDTRERYTLGLTDFVTIPRDGSAAEPLSDGTSTVGERFRKLSARAGEALPYQWRDWLCQFRPILDVAPANSWYALLFVLCGDVWTEADIKEGELVLKTPLQDSVDLIERLGLNTDHPKLPEEVFETSKPGPTPTTKLNEDEKAAVRQSGKRKRKPDPKVAETRKKREEERKREDAILSDWQKEDDNWTDYNDYVRWKNENLPEGWPVLNHRLVERAIENAKRRARYRR